MWADCAWIGFLLGPFIVLALWIVPSAMLAGYAQKKKGLSYPGIFFGCLFAIPMIVYFIVLVVQQFLG